MMSEFEIPAPQLLVAVVGDNRPGHRGAGVDHTAERGRVEQQPELEPRPGVPPHDVG